MCFYRPYKQQTGLPRAVIWAGFLEDFVLACPVAAARGGLTLLTSNASSLLCRVCTCCFVLASLFGVGMNFCAGVSVWRVAALAGLQEPCWHSSVLGLICSPPRPYGPLLLLFISDPSSPARGRGRCFPLAVSQPSAAPCQNPCTLFLRGKSRCWGLFSISSTQGCKHCCSAWA